MFVVFATRGPQRNEKYENESGVDWSRQVDAWRDLLACVVARHNRRCMHSVAREDLTLDNAPANQSIPFSGELYDNLAEGNNLLRCQDMLIPLRPGSFEQKHPFALRSIFRLPQQFTSYHARGSRKRTLFSRKEGGTEGRKKGRKGLVSKTPIGRVLCQIAVTCRSAGYTINSRVGISQARYERKAASVLSRR